jgi:hypothetical protein
MSTSRQLDSIGPAKPVELQLGALWPWAGRRASPPSGPRAPPAPPGLRFGPSCGPAPAAPRPQPGTRPHSAAQGQGTHFPEHNQVWHDRVGRGPNYFNHRLPWPHRPAPPWVVPSRWFSREGPFVGAHDALENASDQLGRRAHARWSELHYHKHKLKTTKALHPSIAR